jgi:hypothetical protein
MPTMTPLQAECLAYIQFLLSSQFKPLGAFYRPSGIMAHIEIESAWRVSVGDDTGDGANSAGLMQVTTATAAGMGLHGDQRNPAYSILSGMTDLDSCRKVLGAVTARQGGGLQVEKIVAAYNEGAGNVMRGRQDPHYVQAWQKAQAKWAFVDTLPMDPKACTALQNWGKVVSLAPTPTTSALPEQSEEPAHGAPSAGEGQNPNPANEQQQGDSSEALNAAELTQLNAAPEDGVAASAPKPAQPKAD